MKLSLQQTEIEAAIRAYVSNQGINTQGKLVIMDFTMGRKGTGLTVEVDVTSPREGVTVTEVSIPVIAQAITKTEDPVEVATEVAEANPGYSTSAPTTASLFGNNP